ncbi:MAG: LEA type 2 family protein [Gemmatimonadaceae bacterium]
MRFRPTPILVLALLAVGAASGCRTLARAAFANPVVEVKDVRVTSIGLQGGSVDVVLDVYNPNEFRLDATRVSYVFWVDTSQVASGAIEKLLTLEQKGRGQIVVPVTFGYAALSEALREYSRFGRLDYRVTGQFTMATPFGTITRPYSGTGRIEGMP